MAKISRQRPLSRLARFLRRLRRRLQLPAVSPRQPFYIAQLSGIALPPDSPLRRTAPRPLEGRPADYDEKFDWHTLFYDVVQTGGRLVLTGPPLRNLESLLSSAEFRLDNVPLRRPPATLRLDRAQLTTIRHQGAVRRFSMRSEQLSCEVAVQQKDWESFAGRKVLLTKSRNNDLDWISDWIEFHVKIHGADAILFYENASDRYTPEEVLERIRTIGGIEAAVVVPWAYKFGPVGPFRPGRKWDSNYSEYAFVEHARRRFLAQAAGVLNTDVDELVVSSDGRSLFEHLALSKSGAVRFDGVWIESVTDMPGGAVRHRHYRYFDPAAARAFRKWAAIPSRIPRLVQMRTHGFTNGFVADQPPELSLRHFKAVNFDWYRRRVDPTPFDPARHMVDDLLVAEMSRAGWNAGVPSSHHPD